MKSTDDSALLDAARRGDRSALDALLERHAPQIYRFGMRMCRDPELAKEVLQDTLLAAARGVRDFRGNSSLSTWLFAIARSFCGKLRRRSGAPARALDDAASELARIADPAHPPDEALASKEVAHALEGAIAALDPMYREVFILRDVEGLTAAEVAQVVGASEQAIKSRLHRARLAVRQRLAPLLGGAEPGPTPGAARCPDVLRLYSRHLEGEISAGVCARMERHVADCTHCRATCDSLTRTLALCKAAPGQSVPIAVQDSVRSAIRELLPAW